MGEAGADLGKQKKKTPLDVYWPCQNCLLIIIIIQLQGLRLKEANWPNLTKCFSFGN